MVQPNPVSRSEEHMLGHGFYNKHSHEQGKANAFTLPLIAEAINQINLDQIGDEFRIADYGSAQGQNSLLPMPLGLALDAYLEKAIVRGFAGDKTADLTRKIDF